MVATKLLPSQSLARPLSSSGRAKQQHFRPHSGNRAAPQALGVDFIPPAFFKAQGTSSVPRGAFSGARPRSAGAIGVTARPSSAPNQHATRLRRSNSTAGMRCSPSDSAQELFYEKPFSIAYKEVAMARNLRKLELLFRESDHDGSGELDIHEFRKALRMPGTHRAFANLGIQPHQCEKIFLYLDDDKSGSLTIHEFIMGLTDLVGTDIDGTGMELDIEMLSAAYKSKQKQLLQKPKQVLPKSASTGNLGLTEEMSQTKDQAVKTGAYSRDATNRSLTAAYCGRRSILGESCSVPFVVAR